MNSKKVIIIIFLTAFLVIGIVLIFGWLVSGNQKPFHEIDCAKAGEFSSHPSLGPKAPTSKECCEGLVKIYTGSRYESDSEYADENGCIYLKGSTYICSDCGNGICESWENRCNCSKDCAEGQVTITTDKTEYEQGETVKITIKNNLEKDICYLSYQGSACYKTPHTIYKFSEGEWKSISIGLSVECPQVELPPLCNKLKSNEEKEFIWDHRDQALIGKYKASINYKEDTEEIKSFETKGIKTIYSNEFTIKEKSALDLRCSEKVAGIGDCDACRRGYEFDSTSEKCVEKVICGCSFEIPFNSLEECQKVCEKNNDMSCKQGVDCIEKCPKCIDNPPLNVGCASQPRCVNEICKCICNCLPSNLLPH